MIVKENSFENRMTAPGESEMQMFRFLLDRPAGVILTVDTDRMLAKLLAQEDLVDLSGDRVSPVSFDRGRNGMVYTEPQ